MKQLNSTLSKILFVLGLLMSSAGSSLATDLVNPPSDTIKVAQPDTICLTTAEFDSLALLIIERDEYEMRYLHMSERYLVQSDVHRIQLAHQASKLNEAQNNLELAKQDNKKTTAKVVIVVAIFQQVANYLWQKAK